MIEKAEITYYQSHKRTTLDFHKGVNVIIGVSDSGKSALMRAFRWLIEGKPSGDKFRSYFGTEKSITSVKFYLDTGDTVMRRIKKGKNQYVVNGKILKAFGRDVPDEVVKMLNMTQINRQLQLDSPYLLTETPGAVAKHFNKVANLDKIDEANANIKRAITKINTAITVQEEKIQEEEEKLKAFPNVEQLDLQLEDLEKLERQRKQNVQSILKLNLLLVDYKENKKKIKEAKEILKHEKAVDEIISLIETRDKNNATIEELQTLIDAIEANDQTIADNEEFLKLEAIVDNVLTMIKARDENKARIRDLKAILTTIKTNKSKARTLNERARELEELFQKEMPDVCPLCETNLKHKHDAKSK